MFNYPNYSGRCPSCGRCSHCGQGFQFQPYYQTNWGATAGNMQNAFGASQQAQQSGVQQGLSGSNNMSGACSHGN